jgi:apolipoprotein N-acyltransferase
MGTLVRLAAWPMVAVAASWLYGEHRIATTNTVDGPRFCMMSADAVPVVSATDGAAILARSNGSRVESVHGAGGADAYLWPEIAFGVKIVDGNISAASRASLAIAHPDLLFDGSDRKALARLATALGGTVFIGATRISEESDRIVHYNCLAVVDPAQGFIGVYDKRFLVPWRENNPLFEWIGLPTDKYSRGKRLTLFTCPARSIGQTFDCGGLVCYDVAFPAATKDYFVGRGDHAPDFFVAASHEAFDASGKLQQQMKTMVRLRAIEVRRSILRNPEGGEPELVDSAGRLVASGRSVEFSRLQAFPPVPVDRRRSVYSYSGDWFPWLCLIAVLWRRHPGALQPPSNA